MADLYKYLSNDNVQQFPPHNDEAIAVDMASPVVETALGLKGLIGGVRAYNGIRPFLGDIWAGRKLLFHKPFNQMTREEFKNYGKLGKDYYKNYLQRNPLKMKDESIIHFGSDYNGKDFPFKMEQYPYLRKQLYNAENIKTTNDKNATNKVYEHLYNTFRNKLYDYLIENNTDKGRYYKMIKEVKE